ncbi:VOC family protein [candidate division TA06 bacterium]|nr:VOC family protein [candidate division TA06 bacterium]
MAILEKMDLVWYRVTNWERAKKFYGETLGLSTHICIDEAGWAEYGPQNSPRLAIHFIPNTKISPGGGTAAFKVKDVVKTKEELEKKGVRCDEIREDSPVKICNFYDPDGNLLQIIEEN